MCTIILFHRRFEEFPLAIAANRDEVFSRPALPWAERHASFSPRDLVHGGTWIGVNKTGLVAALTNRAGAERDASRRSRGEIPDLALAYENASDAAQGLLSLDPRAYNPFHAVVADQRVARVVWSDGESFHSLILGPGVHVITERSFQPAAPGRATLIGRLLRNVSSFDVETLMHVLSDQHPGGIDAPFVSLEKFNYGTRSSAILGISDKQAVFWESPDRPSPESFVDRSDALADFLFTSGPSDSVQS